MRSGPARLGELVTNAWTSDHDTLLCWIADLTPIKADANELLAWQRTVLEGGERLHVFRVLEAPAVDYERDRDGPFPLYLDDRCRSTGELDLFSFTRGGILPVDGRRLRATAKVAHFDAEGNIQETEVDDVGDLLQKLRPGDVDHGWIHMRHGPPLGIDPSISPPLTPEKLARARRIEVRFRLFSDIWMPWVVGSLEPPGSDCPQDNRPLAARHTARLNAFLHAVSAATEACGGRWFFEHELTPAGPYYPVSDAGVDLNAPPPDPRPGPLDFVDPFDAPRRHPRP